MWIYCLIGYLAISSAFGADLTAAKNSTNVKGKRQSDEAEIVQIGDGRQQQQSRQYLPKGLSQHANQRQQQFQQDELPAEYLSLLQELSYQQAAQPQTHQQYYHEAPRQHQPQPPQQAPQQAKGPSKNNQKAAKIQFQVPEHQQNQQYQQQITLNPNYIQQNPQVQKAFIFPQNNAPSQPQPEQNVQYITEDEYNKLIRQQEQNDGLRQYQTQQSQKYQGTQQPKFRPQPSEDIRQFQYLQQIQPQEQQQVQQYRRPAPQQFQQGGHPQQLHYGPRPNPQNSRPLADSSLEKELQRLIESNKPIPFDQRQLQQLPQSQKLTLRPQQSKGHITQEQRPNGAPQPQFSFGPEQVAAYHQQIQPQPSQQNRYIAPAVRQQNQGKFQSPASKYQLLVSPTTSDDVIYNGQNYFPDQQKYVPQYPKQSNQAIKQQNVQFFAAKEKQQQQQQFQYAEQASPSPTIQSHAYETPSVMKIVQAPQLQYEKPTQAQLQQASKNQQKQAKPSQEQRFQKQENNQQYQPSKSTIFVSQTTGAPPRSSNQRPQPNSNYEEAVQQQSPPQKVTHKVTKNEKPPNLPDRPLTQEEFQALVDAGYPVVPVPVPVPYPVYTQQVRGENNKEEQQEQPQQIVQYVTPAPASHQPQRHHQQNIPSSRYSSAASALAPAYRYQHQPQQQAESSNPSITYLRPMHSGQFSGLHGPSQESA